MGLAYIEGAGGGGVRSSDVTASAADILSGKTDLTAQSDDEVVQGTMPNNGTVNHSLPINGSFTIANGYHSGSGKVTQSVTTKAAATYYATTSDQTISANQYLTGAQTIKKLTQTNLSGGNIKPGVVVKVNNGNTDVFSVTGSMASKGAGTYYATTADQTIAANQYLTGVQTIKKLTQTGLSAANILNGTTIKINNGNADVWSVTGTRVTPVRNTYVVAIKGFGAPQNILSDEDTYTMERAGVVYFGMATLGVSGSPKAKAELLVNNVVKKSVELDGSYSSYSYQYQVWASENLAKNDVVKVRVTITQGTHVFAMLGAHMAC